LAGFVAEGVVEPLAYDFKPYVKAEGVIPEPTDTQIAEFLRGIKAVFKDAQKDIPDDIDTDDPVAVLKAIDDLDPGAQVEAMQKMAEVYAALCSGTPTAKQISDLPMRVRSVFFNWLQGEVMAPEAATGAGNAQVTPLRGARAG
jgi:hypothetical protein